MCRKARNQMATNPVKEETHSLIKELVDKIDTIEKQVVALAQESIQTVKDDTQRQIEKIKADGEHRIQIIQLELKTEEQKKRQALADDIAKERVVLESVKKEKGDIKALYTDLKNAKDELESLKNSLSTSQDNIKKIYSEKSTLEKEMKAEQHLHDVEKTNLLNRCSTLENQLVKANEQIVSLQAALTNIASGESTKTALEKVIQQIQLSTRK